MGLNRLRVDSIAELQRKKSNEELQEENEQLKNRVEALEEQLTSTQLALCDVFEQVVSATTGEV